LDTFSAKPRNAIGAARRREHLLEHGHRPGQVLRPAEPAGVCRVHVDEHVRHRQLADRVGDAAPVDLLGGRARSAARALVTRFGSESGSSTTAIFCDGCAANAAAITSMNWLWYSASPPLSTNNSPREPSAAQSRFGRL
jgi:hypothetical protein